MPSQHITRVYGTRVTCKTQVSHTWVLKNGMLLNISQTMVSC